MANCLTGTYIVLENHWLLFSFSANIRNTLRKNGMTDTLGLDKMYVSLHDAVICALQQEHRDMVSTAYIWYLCFRSWGYLCNKWWLHKFLKVSLIILHFHMIKRVQLYQNVYCFSFFYSLFIYLEGQRFLQHAVQVSWFEFTAINSVNLHNSCSLPMMAMN